MTRRLHEYADLQAAVRDMRPRIALVLGSGLSELADQLRGAVALPFACVPGLEAPSVTGHRGALLLGTWADVPVLVFAGRLHYYEGFPWRRVVQPVHIARELGASILCATNAAGGIRDDLQAGDLMAVRAALEWTRPRWWHECAPRSNPFSERLAALLQQSARQLGFTLSTGVYAQLTGPCYETPAEIRALRVCGADAVGMSTAREVQAAAALGMECTAISCITNKAAGLGSGPIHHQEVLSATRQVKERLTALLVSFLQTGK